MALIVVPQHTGEDLEHWSRISARDLVLGRREETRAVFRRAYESLLRFAEGGPFYCSVSWGKDSVVLAHLCAIARAEEGVETTLAWVRVRGVENPWCTLVRDAFLARYPLPYLEVRVQHDPSARRTSAAGFAEVVRRTGVRRHVSGIRADESPMRARRMFRGDTERTGAPLGWVAMEEVYAWCAAEDLPLHPVYAMSMGGRWPRRALRVSAIGGERGIGRGRREWERRYCSRAMRGNE